MLRFALTIFTSAFLLFLVQPMLGKYILPWFGGGAGVWNACMMFFQIMLLGGYLYAHLVGRLSSHNQARVHLGMLALSLCLLPITPGEHWKPDPAGSPIAQIVLLLAVHVGAPYLMISSTGPLMQRWFAITYPGQSPYRLYALSNVGSLLALLSYPTTFELLFGLRAQTWIWTGLYAVYAVLGAICAVRLLRAANIVPERLREVPAELRPGAVTIVFWLVLSGCGSVMLLSATNLMCIDVAVVPFLWVLPLTLYLLTFIICFESDRWYYRPLFVPLMIGAIVLQSVVLRQGAGAQLALQVVALSLTVFACCMTCHGELVRLRPHTRYLTLFYLMISTGGALGGIFVTLVAPQVFLGFWEFHAALILSALLVFYLVSEPVQNWLTEAAAVEGRTGQAAIGVLVAVVGCGALAAEGYALGQNIQEDLRDTQLIARNFFGVIRVKDDYADAERTVVSMRTLLNGRINHGLQLMDDENRATRTTYYGPKSGLGVAILNHPRREQSQPLRIGMIGLGTGTVAGWGEAGDYLRIYEIDPKVVALSENGIFSFVADARQRGADTEILLGDARIVLERQEQAGELQQFDILGVDAFSSDAIPVHLLTRECHDLYWRHLKPDGVLAIHISNRFIELEPVVRALGEVSGKPALMVYDRPVDTRPDATISSQWMLLTTNETFLADEQVQSAQTHFEHLAQMQPVLWTDDFSNVYSLVEFHLFKPKPSED